MPGIAVAGITMAGRCETVGSRPGETITAPP